ncbi:MAG: DNA repair protein RadA [Candidatus Eisenbacteria bacterium]|uniref:DNA repair protein RadA n=1 Tax=Eiseniibacteriota bacterium TaxID=2212470 RepID=A0A956NIH4_UNCEI|nr:DNA repair protein RadA [Candidatus Eisenbacteria bacterium]MCB9463655.1 DNA repair protein RadA [Candidatus Eisenbacteria bacterium]
MSKKARTRYVCGDCGDDFAQWFGRCPTCKEWNTLKEFRPPAEADTPVRAGSGSLLGAKSGPRPSGFFASAAGPAQAGLLGKVPKERPLKIPGGARDGRTATSSSRTPNASTRDADPDATMEAVRVDPSLDRETRPNGGRVPPEIPSTPTPPVRAAQPEAATSTASVPASPPPSPSPVVPDSVDPRTLPTLLRLEDVPLNAVPRLETGIHELDRILGGGLVPGAVVLIGGDPGIGKSTLLLQAAGRLVARGVSALYVTGEESAGQIRLRAERLREVPPGLLVHTETNLEEVAQAVEEIRPRVLVVDSIQTAFLPGVASAPGSVTQVRESALALIDLAKRRGISVLLVGHVTKEGAIAGPKTLEHMVDAVVYMEGERYQHYRILRSVKNRFGGVDELGVFEMGPNGLVEVANPSQVFLSEHTAGAVGSVVATSIEGTRALLLEVQALVVHSQYANPQRVSTGYDRRRLELLLAVLDKRTQLDLARRDVFVNIAGGLRVVEPGVDLGVLLAVASSATDAPPHTDLVAVGEVGLGGEIRRISHPERRVQEIARLGYRKALLPWSNAKDLGSRRDGVELLGAQSVAEALSLGLNANAPLG